MADLLVNLNETRENLLREYHITKGTGRTKVLARILELEEEIAAEKSAAWNLNLWNRFRK